MDKYFYPTPYNECYSLFMLGLKLTLVSKRAPDIPPVINEPSRDKFNNMYTAVIMYGSSNGRI